MDLAIYRYVHRSVRYFVFARAEFTKLKLERKRVGPLPRPSIIGDQNKRK